MLTCVRATEKCFVDPILNTTTTPSPDSSSNGTSSQPVGGSSSDSSSATWGLTISGFYYVALNRQTGQIDGLYYDPGSQPYQSLRMAPEGMALPTSTAVTAEGGAELADGASARGTRHLYDDGIVGSGKRNANAEVRRWFPAVEFR